MDIVIVGYGKMGHAIEDEAKRRGDDVIAIYDEADSKDLMSLKDKIGDKRPVIIDFTGGNAFLSNLDAYCALKLPVVVGATGWYDKLSEVETKVKDSGIGLIYAGNFSLGVQAFFYAIRMQAKALAEIGGYDVGIFESHHSGKADAPSGTAKTMTDILLEEMPEKREVLIGNPEGRIRPDQLQVVSMRLGADPGTHEVSFNDGKQTIKIGHYAMGRSQFASGALIAADYIRNETGICTMQDFMQKRFDFAKRY